MSVRARNEGPVKICTFCGSTSPETPAPACAHGRVAEVRGDARQAAARLWIAIQALEAHRAAFEAALYAEIKAGSATVDSCPPVRCQESNVAFLHGREVQAGDLPPVRVG